MNNNIFQNDLILKVRLIPAKKFKNIKKTKRLKKNQAEKKSSTSHDEYRARD